MKTGIVLSKRNILSAIAWVCICIPASLLAAQHDSDRATPAQGLIQLQAPLDEPEYYCVDVPGFRSNVQLQSALMAHTCKPGAADETFTVNHPSPGQIFMEAYDLCVQAERAEAGSELFLKACSDSPLQRFDFTADAEIRLLHPDAEELCLTVAAGTGEATGGPSHLRRDMMFQTCSDIEPERSYWTIPAPSSQ